MITIGISLTIIVAVTIYFRVTLSRAKKNNRLKDQRRFIEHGSTVVSTLGVLGTFLGITLGLLDFDTEHINNSIPTLLEGLKTAFFTSLGGMMGSLYLNWATNSAYDKLDAEELKEKDSSRITDMNNAAGLIVKAVESMQKKSEEDSNKLYSLLEEIKQKHYDEIVEQETTNSHLEDLSDKIESIEKSSAESSKHYALLLEAIKDSENSGFDKLDNRISNLTNSINNMVKDIENKMSETNTLLTEKFDEFSTLLQKSNTEALVDVMRNVTEEFQKQMNELIGRLVKENFEQLNQSVNQLNSWQKDNKEMIVSLTSQYKQMEAQFASTSNTLSKVGEDTKLLVSDGGKLNQIVSALNTVMVEDEKFKQITQNLSATASLSKDNMEAFKESTDHLNEWVKKQRNFVESVQLLIVKLEEIAKIKDYSDEFWKGQKQGMIESINTLKQGSMTLNNQLNVLDQKFYNRLNATLVELDRCIQSMVNGRR